MLKAIETRYKGYRFRSRLEARWAVFFDTLGISWEYEKEGFDLNSTWYLPDFWLPDIGWVEIKGDKPTEDEINKCRLLCELTHEMTIIFSGMPDEGNLSNNAIQFYWFPPWDDDKLIAEMRTDPEEYGGMKRIDEIENGYAGQNNPCCFSEIFLSIVQYDDGVSAARAARFEHLVNL